jgi:tetratricopeptide (TPR) repeat protein
MSMRQYSLQPPRPGSAAKARPLARRILVCAAALCCCAVLLPFSTFASSSGALRDYKAGNYDNALKEYERLLQRNSGDPRLRFNAGAAAYQNQQFDEAFKQFDQTLQSSTDLKLQELAYYNRANSLYWLGERTTDPAKKTENWEKALKDFDSSLKLNPQDADARFNREFVKKRIEQLKQQQQQQQQSKPDQNKNPDQNQQQNQQQPKPQDNQQQDQQKSSSQQQQEQKPDSSHQEQQPKPEEQKENPEQQQAQPKPQPGDDENKNEQQMAGKPADTPRDMTPEEARQLLDAQKGEEQMLQLKPEPKPVDPARPLKDW